MAALGHQYLGKKMLLPDHEEHGADVRGWRSIWGEYWWYDEWETEAAYENFCFKLEHATLNFIIVYPKKHSLFSSEKKLIPDTDHIQDMAMTQESDGSKDQKDQSGVPEFITEFSQTQNSLKRSAHTW